MLTQVLKELGETSKLMKNFLFNAHPSVKRIRRNIETNEKFSFQQLTGDLVLKIILNLDSFKATPVGDILADNFMIDTLQNLWTSFRKNFTSSIACAYLKCGRTHWIKGIIFVRCLWTYPRL